MGEVGNNMAPQPQPFPQTVMNVSGATAVTVGDQSACARLSSGAVMCWGSNQGGQLGVGSTLQRASMMPVIATCQ
jgi:alpha-tubulin suppressor-like RCC1 family protein